MVLDHEVDGQVRRARLRDPALEVFVPDVAPWAELAVRSSDCVEG